MGMSIRLRHPHSATEIPERLFVCATSGANWRIALDISTAPAELYVSRRCHISFTRAAADTAGRLRRLKRSMPTPFSSVDPRASPVVKTVHS